MAKQFLKNNFDYISWGIVLIIYSIIFIGDHHIRLANIHSDNGAVFYSYLFKNDYFYSDSDIKYEIGKHWVFGSICFWLPAIFYKYFNLNPFFLDYLLYVLQIFLTGFGFYILTYALSKNSLVASISSAFSLISLPLGWNLAAYPFIVAQPFYTSLAMTTSMVVLATFILGKKSIYWTFMYLTALCHPVIGIYTGFFLLTCNLASNGFTKRPYFGSICRVVLFCLICCSPLFLKNSFDKSQMISEFDQFTVLTKHMHSFPLNNYPTVFWSLASQFIGIVLLSIALFRNYLALKTKEKIVFYSVVLTCIFFSLLQLLGIALQNTLLINLMGLRSVYLLSSLLWCILFAYLYKFGLNANNFQRFNYIFCVSSWCAMDFHISLFVTLSLLITEIVGNKYRNISLAASLLTITPIFLPWETGGLIPLTFYMNGFIDSAIKYGALLLVSLVLTPIIWRPFTSVALLKPLIICLLIFLIGVHSLRSFHETMPGSRLHDLYLAQIWAKENSIRSDTFLTAENWNTISQRPSTTLIPALTQEVYTPLLNIHNYNLIILKLCGIQDSWKSLAVFEINEACNKVFFAMDELQASSMGQVLSAKFLVWDSSRKQLNLPLVYHNQNFLIYKLQ